VHNGFIIVIYVLNHNISSARSKYPFINAHVVAVKQVMHYLTNKYRKFFDLILNYPMDITKNLHILNRIESIYSLVGLPANPGGNTIKNTLKLFSTLFHIKEILLDLPNS
jgi:hypothetical protein